MLLLQKHQIKAILLLTLLFVATTSCREISFNPIPFDDYALTVKNRIDAILLQKNKPLPDFGAETLKRRLDDYNVIFESMLSLYYDPKDYDDLVATTINSLDTSSNMGIGPMIDKASLSLLSSTDSYTFFMTNKSYRSLLARVKNKDKTFGFSFTKSGAKLILANIDKKSSLAVHKIKRGDVIVKINNTILNRPSQTETILNSVKFNDSINLTIQRSDKSLVDVKVVKIPRPLKSVVADFILKRNGKTVFFFKINNFNDTTDFEFRDKFNILLDATNQVEPSAMILDLRNSSGDNLESAAEVCDFFVRQGDLFTIKKDQSYYYYRAENSNLASPDLKISVLINRNTAYVSELVAGCLYERSRAILIGEKTYGKSKSQIIVPLNYGRAIQVSISEVSSELGPDRSFPFIPDIKVANNPDTKIDEVIDRALQELTK